VQYRAEKNDAWALPGMTLMVVAAKAAIRAISTMRMGVSLAVPCCVQITTREGASGRSTLHETVKLCSVKVRGATKPDPEITMP
jgi:hypothetical protein